MKTEYKVRPVERYVVTKFTSDSPNGGRSETIGEFDNYERAYLNAYALAGMDAKKRGLPDGDPGVTFPEYDASKIGA